jgi:virulence factor Mce-like protein
VTKPYKAAAAVVVCLLGISIAAVSIRGAYGAFADRRPLVARFEHAGQILTPGSNVKYRGVNIGRVDSVRLVDRMAEVRLSVNREIDVPKNVVATVQPKTLFGEKFIDLDFPDGQRGPFLGDHGRITDTHTSEEVEGLFEGAVPLFRDVNATELAEVISELSKGARGEGDQIAASIDSGARLADLFSSTIDAQMRALDSFARFQEAIRTVGPDLNAISANSNLSLPEFNRTRADFERLLTTLRPFADNLADILRVYRPDIDAILDSGQNVVRVLIARQPEISETIHGLYRYLLKLGTGASPESLGDGTKFAYFKNFLLFSDVENLICASLAPPQPNAAFLVPLQQALLNSGGPLDCSAYFQAGVTPASAAATPSRAEAAQRLADLTGQAMATPDQPEPQTVKALVDKILGRSS